jgi:hypothetical protein
MPNSISIEKTTPKVKSMRSKVDKLPVKSWKLIDMPGRWVIALETLAKPFQPRVHPSHIFFSSIGGNCTSDYGVL